jgi:hypothetical protein
MAEAAGSPARSEVAAAAPEVAAEDAGAGAEMDRRLRRGHDPPPRSSRATRSRASHCHSPAASATGSASAHPLRLQPAEAEDVAVGEAPGEAGEGESEEDVVEEGAEEAERPPRHWPIFVGRSWRPPAS